MGLLSWWRVKRMRDPVAGSLLVTVCPQPHTAPTSASYSAIVLGVVSGPGLAPQPVELHCTVRAKRCPSTNQRVPVTVDRADPTRIVIAWSQVPIKDPLEAARAATAARAAAMRRSSKR